MKLNIKAFTLSLGIVYGIIIFVVTWWLIVQGKFVNEEVFLSDIYPFFKISPAGSLLGLLYGFVDGVIFGAGFAWLYNSIAGVKKTTSGQEK